MNLMQKELELVPSRNRVHIANLELAEIDRKFMMLRLFTLPDSLTVSSVRQRFECTPSSSLFADISFRTWTDIKGANHPDILAYCGRLFVPC